jgi:hypothetical protein
MYDPAAAPFTCQKFTYERGSDDPSGALNILKPSNNYTIAFANTVVGQYNGKAIAIPSDAGWSAAGFKFKTDDFSIMAVGYQDQNSGYYVFLDKANKGLMKDLDAVGAANFSMPADSTPFLIMFSSQVADPTLITVTRDGKAADVGIDYFDAQGREIGIGPNLNDWEYINGIGSNWQGGATYVVTVPAAAAGVATGATIGADKVYTFKIGAASHRVRAVIPSTGAVAQSVRTLSLASASSSSTSGIALVTSDPVDASTLTGVVVKKADGSVVSQAKAQLLPKAGAICGVAAGCGNDNQWIRVTFDQTTPFFLDPGTTYTIEAKGLKVAADATNAGAAIADFSSTFTTASYRTTGIFKIDAGYAASGLGPADPAIDRGASSITFTDPNTNVAFAVRLDPTLLRDGSFLVKFTNTPTSGTVTTSSVVLSEIGPTGAEVAVDPSKYTVTADTGRTLSTARSFVIQITDANYPLRYNTKYLVRVNKGVTDSISGKVVQDENCASGDCPVLHQFTTRLFSASISVTNTATGAFSVVFSAPVDAASVNAALATSAKLYKVNADGSLDPNAITMTCATVADGVTSVPCTTTTVLAGNTKYVASATFLSTAPAKVRSVVSTFNVDPVTATFFGSPTATFATPCP